MQDSGQYPANTEASGKFAIAAAGIDKGFVYKCYADKDSTNWRAGDIWWKKNGENDFDLWSAAKEWTKYYGLNYEFYTKCKVHVEWGRVKKKPKHFYSFCSVSVEFMQ